MLEPEDAPNTLQIRLNNPNVPFTRSDCRLLVSRAVDQLHLVDITAYPGFYLAVFTGYLAAWKCLQSICGSVFKNSTVVASFYTIPSPIYPSIYFYQPDTGRFGPTSFNGPPMIPCPYEQYPAFEPYWRGSSKPFYDPGSKYGAILCTDLFLELVDPKRLFFGNLPYTTSLTHLKQELEAKGFQDFSIEMPVQSQGKGYALVTFERMESAQKAIANFDGLLFHGRRLTVRLDRFPSLGQKNRENSSFMCYTSSTNHRSHDHNHGQKQRHSHSQDLDSEAQIARTLVEELTQKSKRN